MKEGTTRLIGFVFVTIVQMLKCCHLTVGFRDSYEKGLTHLPVYICRILSDGILIIYKTKVYENELKIDRLNPFISYFYHYSPSLI